MTTASAMLTTSRITVIRLELSAAAALSAARCAASARWPSISSDRAPVSGSIDSYSGPSNVVNAADGSGTGGGEQCFDVGVGGREQIFDASQCGLVDRGAVDECPVVGPQLVDLDLDVLDLSERLLGGDDPGVRLADGVDHEDRVRVGQLLEHRAGLDSLAVQGVRSLL